MLQKPQIFNHKKDAPHGAVVVEAFENSLRELFFISHPQAQKGTRQAEEEAQKFIASHQNEDCWIYYPHTHTLVHSVQEESYFTLRTARNRNIITNDEQERYRNAKVGVAGLSVGSAILSALVMSGGPKNLKIADFDIIEISNLNRMKASLLDVGTSKAFVAARQIWEIDPFANLTVYEKGIGEDTMQEFIAGDPRLDIFVDEMDNIKLKILARLRCQENKIPVLMATDNGDGIILDVERFDLEPSRPLFHGTVEDIIHQDLEKLDYRQWLSFATKIVSAQYLTQRMQESILEIGKTIAAVPQLGTSAALGGSAVAYASRRIANSQDMPSGRYVVSLEASINALKH